MKGKRTRIFLRSLTVMLLLGLFLSVPVHAEQYYFDLDVSTANSQESAVLTASDASGNVKWRYQSPSYPLSQFDHFSLVTNDRGCIYLVEDGAIKSFDFYTGNVLWTNRDFQGHPADGCYAFSSSDKLYISGYSGPDLFVVDKDGQTVCRVAELDPGSWWPDRLYFSGGDNMTIHYGNNDKSVTFNVLDYFSRKDGLSSSQAYSDQTIAAIRQALRIPSSANVEVRIDYDHPFYWEGAGMYLVHCEIVENGEVVASADLDRDTGQVATSIWSSY